MRACHLQPTLAVTGFTSALAIGARRGRGSVAAGAAVLAGQLSVGWSNDYIDRHRDRIAGRLDKPIVAGAISARAVRNAAVAALLACVPLSLLSGRRAGLVHLGAVSVALAYNARLKATVFSVVPYIAAFGALPAFVSLGAAPPRRPPGAATLAAALLGAGAHFVNVLPDLADDATTGVVGLPHRLGAARSMLVGAALLGGAATVVARGGDAPLSRASRLLVVGAEVTVAGVVVAGVAGHHRAAWKLSLATAAATVALYLSRSGDL